MQKTECCNAEYRYDTDSNNNICLKCGRACWLKVGKGEKLKCTKYSPYYDECCPNPVFVLITNPKTDKKIALCRECLIAFARRHENKGEINENS